MTRERTRRESRQPFTPPIAAPVLVQACLAAVLSGGCFSPDARDWKDDSDTGEEPDTDTDTDADPAMIEMVRIAPGTFTMGSSSSEVGRYSDETQHEVTLTGAFYIGVYEITQDQFDDFMGYNPSYFSSYGGSCPVEQVSWHEVAAFANAVSTEAGLAECYTCSGSGSSASCSPSGSYSSPYDCPGYRLSTEAEWEYAARAGTTSAFSSGGDLYSGDESNCSGSLSLTDGSVLDDFAWYCGNSSSSTHPVGSLDPNPWGLHDMHGNVWEWCHDWYGSYPSGSVTDPTGSASGSDRVSRGGSWSNTARDVRVAFRNRDDPGDRRGILGFRLSRSSP